MTEKPVCVFVLALFCVGAQAQKSAAPASRVFRDCPICPEMVVVPAGNFSMGSSAEEKSWAASRGGTPGSVADEAPQHKVSLQSFAISKYDVTRGEYAAFVRETKRPTRNRFPISFHFSRKRSTTLVHFSGDSRTVTTRVSCFRRRERNCEQ